MLVLDVVGVDKSSLGSVFRSFKALRYCLMSTRIMSLHRDSVRQRLTRERRWCGNKTCPWVAVSGSTGASVSNEFLYSFYRSFT